MGPTDNDESLTTITADIASMDLTDYSQLGTILPLAASTPTSNVLTTDFFRSEQEIADDFFKAIEQLVHNFVNRPNCLFPYYRVMRWTTDNREHFMSTIEFEDIFDIILDDEHNELENILEEYNENFDFDYVHTNVDEEETIPPIQISSQCVTEKTRTEVQLSETLPAYLQITNTLFPTSQISTKDLQELLFLKHKMAAIRFDQELHNRLMVNLTELNQRLEQYQNEFEQRKVQLKLDTDIEMEQKMDLFIEQYGLPILRDELNYKIAILEYNHDIELLQREYIQQKASSKQIQFAQYILGLKTKCVESKLDLLEIRQHILRQQQIPPRSTKVPDPNIDFSESNETNDDPVELILRAEKSISKYQQLFDQEIDTSQDLTGKLIHIIHRSLKIIDKKLYHMYDYKMKKIFSNKPSSIPTFIIDTALTSHGLTYEQIQLLNRGPTYIPPFQMYLQSSTDEYLQKQYRYLQQYLTKLYTKFNINPARSMFISKDIKDLYMNTFTVELPTNFYQRALYENQLVHSIRQHCSANSLILKRLANQTNVFYLGQSIDYQQKVNEYFSRMNVFEMCEMVDDINLQPTYEYLHKIIRMINEQMDNILKKKKNVKDLIKKLHIDKSKVRLPYLYFLPEITKTNGLTLKPIVVGRKSATSRLAHFLDQLLRPRIQRHTQGTTFIDGSDFIYKLNEFASNKKQFHSYTTFVTMTIKNLDFMVPHGELLIELQEYLNEQLAVPFIDNLSINEIIHLTSLFLHHTRVYYDHKIYRFVKGSPSSLPLTDTLLNILAFQWQRKHLLQEPLISREFYGRCKHRIFFTWNDTQEKFEDFIYKLANKYPDLPLDVTFGQQSHFFDVFLENRNGTLYTKVYHDINRFQYALPYVITNSKDAHSHWLRSALIRAVRYCTHVNDFNRERIHLEVTCLTNGYSFEFIEQRLQHFYKHFDVESLRSSLDQTTYMKLRHRLFNFLSEQHEFSKTKKSLELNNRRIELNYPYEYGPKQEFNKKLRAILIQNFEAAAPSPHSNNAKKLKVILHTKQQYSLNALLTEQKPNHPLINENNIIL